MVHWSQSNEPSDDMGSTISITHQLAAALRACIKHGVDVIDSEYPLSESQEMKEAYRPFRETLAAYDAQQQSSSHTDYSPTGLALAVRQESAGGVRMTMTQLDAIANMLAEQQTEPPALAGDHSAEPWSMGR